MLSWGQFPLPVDQSEVAPTWRDELASEMEKHKPVLPRGLGRSYGDVCLTSQGTLLNMVGVDRIMAFDQQTGVIRVEVGMSIAQLLRLIVPQGWFIPVTPGTKHVTIGGAIANDIHGKNHHIRGTIGGHVTQFELVRSDVGAQVCSSTQHGELFAATIGGLGLTGVMAWVELQLMPIPSASMDCMYTAFTGIDQFVRLSDASNAPYSVAWIDTTSKNISGLFMEGAHAKQGERTMSSSQRVSIPFYAPQWLLHPLSIRAFNRCYGWMQRLLPVKRTQVSIDTFFYPLDAVGHWNRLYGKRGFLQYQFVVPESAAFVVDHVLSRLRAAGHLSFLSVLKKFGTVESPGVLSFPQPGLTLALDLPCKPSLFPLLNELDQSILAVGGKIYPAKDSRMSAEVFKQMYPRWHELERMRDPNVQSDFWKRVTS